LQVIAALARDLELGVEIVGMPTRREADGLAMSSRNAYLSAGDRARAVALSRGLFAAQAAASGGETDVSTLVAVARAALQRDEIREDYLEVRHAVTLAPLTTLEPGMPARMLVAAFVGTTRLIDNLALTAKRQTTENAGIEHLDA
jgi:pantoate--beta-alanine ligase